MAYFRVMTWNIAGAQHGEGWEWTPSRARKIAAVISFFRPHVLCLQEVERKQPQRGRDMWRMISNKLKGPARHLEEVQLPDPEDHRAHRGHSLQRVTASRLTPTSTLRGQWADAISVTPPSTDTSLRVINAHLAAGQPDIEWLEEFAGEQAPGDLPLVVAGDMNRSKMGVLSPGARPSQLSDLAGDRWSTVDKLSRPDLPDARRNIDVVFDGLPAPWVPAGNVCHEMGMAPPLSDHYPVIQQWRKVE